MLERTQEHQADRLGGLHQLRQRGELGARQADLGQRLLQAALDRAGRLQERPHHVLRRRALFVHD
jgi:hypothetical protein